MINTPAKIVLLLVLMATACLAQKDESSKYPWQWNKTSCTKGMSFCWYGPELVSDPEITAFGSKRISQDKNEKPFEWITAVRCLKTQHLCILARNESLVLGGKTQTNIDLYYIQEWSDFQVRALEESDFPKGQECEIDSLIINRAEASVSMLSVPGPVAASKRCAALIKPKTVIYQLQLEN